MSETREKTPQELCETIKELQAEVTRLKAEFEALRINDEVFMRDLTKQRDALRKELDDLHKDMNQNPLYAIAIKDRDRLKDELKTGNALYAKITDRVNDIEADRDRWRTLAEKMVKAFKTINAIDTVQDARAVAREALAAYDAETGKP